MEIELKRKEKDKNTLALASELVAGRQWLAGEPRISRLADGGVRVVAPAKINLNLWVGPCREDGYHPVESLVATISLADRLTVRAGKEGKKGCELICSNPGLSCGEDNLVVRAGRAMAERAKLPLNVKMELEKSIPIGAGLGGGSSDAAACLLALNTLWQTGYSKSELAKIAGEIGSDVALFLDGGVCVVRGRGELVEDLGFDWPFWAVIMFGGNGLSTKLVYDKFDELLTEPVGNDRIDQYQLGLYEPEAAEEMLFNELGEAAFALLPELAHFREALLAAGAGCVQISGSGSALYCLFNSLVRARSVVSRLSPQMRRNIAIVHGGHR